MSSLPAQQKRLKKKIVQGGPWGKYRAGIYNFGQNKMRNRSTPSPNSMMYSRYNENALFFPSLKWGEGWRGSFSSILSKIVGPIFDVRNLR